MIDDPTDYQRRIAAETTLLRGSIITCYAQIEWLLAETIVQCSQYGEYLSLKIEFKERIHGRIECIKNIIGLDGPLSPYSNDLMKIIEIAENHEELRHYLVHGISVISFPTPDTNVINYKMYKMFKGGNLGLGGIVTDTEQLGRVAETLASNTKDFIFTTRAIWQALGWPKIEISYDS